MAASFQPSRDLESHTSHTASLVPHSPCTPGMAQCAGIGVGWGRADTPSPPLPPRVCLLSLLLQKQKVAPFGSSFTFVSKGRREKKSQEVWGQRLVRVSPPGANSQERGPQPARMPRHCRSQRTRFSSPRDSHSERQSYSLETEVGPVFAACAWKARTLSAAGVREALGIGQNFGAKARRGR